MTMILPALTITAAIGVLTPWTTVYQLRERANGNRNLSLQANFTYGSGGTTVDAYVQSSFDGGTTWFDVANFHFTTSSALKAFNLSSATPVTTQATLASGALASNTAVDGLLGPLVRVAYKSSGTYAGNTTLQIDAQGGDRIVGQTA